MGKVWGWTWGGIWILGTIGKIIGEACGAAITMNADPQKGKTFQFDLCDVIDCWGAANGWVGYNVYMCPYILGYPNSWTLDCDTWMRVWWWTGPNQGWVKSPPNVGSSKGYREFKEKISLFRGGVINSNRGVNPMILTLKPDINNPFKMEGWSSQTCNTHHQNKNREHGCGDVLYLRVGVDISGIDPWGIIRVNLATHTTHTPVPTGSPVIVQEWETDKLTPRESIAVETGFVESNAWLDTVIQYANQTQIGDCWVCAKGRPSLRMTRTPFEDGAFNCGMELMTNTRPSPDCLKWEEFFPMAPAKVSAPTFRVDPLKNLTCVTNSNPSKGAYNVGVLSREACAQYLNLTGTPSATRVLVARADIWWYCGGKILYNWLPVNWDGTCALVTLNVPIFMSAKEEGATDLNALPKHHHWSKRSLQGTINDDAGIWFDAIGQARGIPDQFKLADEVAAGFESFPLFSAIFPITVNKNVNRINLIHYNVQRLVNITRDITKAIHEQLSQTSLMTLQNRVAIDMILAEQGGVCALFGDMCCTTISNNTGPDGSLTKGLTKLRSLAKELKEQSGVSNPVLDWLHRQFGKWGTVLGQLAIGLSLSVTIFITCGCCCIPCIRALVTRTIDRAIQGKDDPPPHYQAPQISGEDGVSIPSLACPTSYEWDEIPNPVYAHMDELISKNRLLQLDEFEGEL